MKRKLLKILVCLFGMLFLTFPAWSAVPSMLPDDGGWNQAPAVADVENPLFEGDMVLSGSGGVYRRGGGAGAGGKGGFSGRKTHSQNQKRVQTRSKQRSQVQTKSQTRTQTQAKTETRSQSQTQLQTEAKTQSQSQVQAIPKKSTQDGGSGTTQ